MQVEIKESNRWLWPVIAAFVLLAATGSVAFFLVHRRLALTAKDTVVLADPDIPILMQAKAEYAKLK